MNDTAQPSLRARSDFRVLESGFSPVALLSDSRSCVADRRTAATVQCISYLYGLRPRLTMRETGERGSSEKISVIFQHLLYAFHM